MSAPTCYIHPSVIATTSCDNCHQAICASDHRRMSGTSRVFLLCPTCYNTKRKTNQTMARIAIVIFALMFLAPVLFIGLHL